MGTQKPDPLNDLSEDDLKLMIIIHSAFATASVAAVVQLSSREQFNLPLLVSLACFAINIPISLLVVLLLNYHSMRKSRRDSVERPPVRYWPNFGFIQAFRYLAYVTCFGGFLAIFWSFHEVIALIFIVASTIAFVFALTAESYKTKQK